MESPAYLWNSLPPPAFPHAVKLRRTNNFFFLPREKQFGAVKCH